MEHDMRKYIYIPAARSQIKQAEADLEEIIRNGLVESVARRDTLTLVKARMRELRSALAD